MLPSSYSILAPTGCSAESDCRPAPSKAGAHSPVGVACRRVGVRVATLSVLPLTNPAMSKAPGVNPIPEAELATPSCGHRCATSITLQLGDVVPAPQETSAHALSRSEER